MDAFFEVRIVGANKGIAKIPSIVGEAIIGRRKPQRSQILDEKYGSGSGIPFPKYMDLLEIGYKDSNMVDDPIHG